MLFRAVLMLVLGLVAINQAAYGSPDKHSAFKSAFVGTNGIMRPNIPESSSYTGYGFDQSADYIWNTTEPTVGGGGISSGSGGGGGCFPLHAGVIDSNKGNIRISDVQVGDKLLSVTAQRRLLYSDVIGWLHRDADKTVEFYEITTTDGKRITLSGDHIIFKANPAVHVFASALQVGDHVLTKPEEPKSSESLAVVSQVSNITTIWLTGVYAPLTREGTIVVDRVAASCYAAVDDHNLAHAALFPVRAVDRLVPGVFAENSGYLQSYLDVLQYTARLLMEKKRFHDNFHQPSVKL